MAAQGQLLADVWLGSGANCVAWCPINGIVAVGARMRPDLACVHLLNVHCVSRKVTLCVPLQGETEVALNVKNRPLPANYSRSTAGWQHTANLQDVQASLHAAVVIAATANAYRCNCAHCRSCRRSCSSCMVTSWLQASAADCYAAWQAHCLDTATARAQLTDTLHNRRLVAP